MPSTYGLRMVVGVVAVAGVAAVGVTHWSSSAEAPRPKVAPIKAQVNMDGPYADPYAATQTDEQFLDELQRRSFRFFIEQAHPETGLVADRARADGSMRVYEVAPPSKPVASVASVGFGLTGLCIAEQRGWITRDEAYAQAEKTLRFLWESTDNAEGFFYHFVDMKTGKRAWQCEASSIDTALLLAGALTVRQHFPDTEAARLAKQIYDRVDWAWMMDDQSTLSMGYKPEKGFIKWRWDHFSEHLVMQLLGLGSETRPLPTEAWHAWRRGPVMEHGGGRFMSYPPLFVHQFSHAWVDFRNKRDDYADYWTNSVIATAAHREMCVALAGKFPLFGDNMWGITSSDSAQGYTAWGGPDPSPHIDGTIVPCAAAGSIPFAPQQCIRTLRHMRAFYGDQAWSHYGFVDAFNPHTGWAAKDVIGIDVGITLVMIENYRTGLPWERFMANPEVKSALQRANFRALPSDYNPTTALFFEPEPETKFSLDFDDFNPRG